MSNIKVTVLGAAGGIGQPLSLLIKLNPYVTHLALYDVVNVPGVAADLHHIDTDVIVSSYTPPENKDDENIGLQKALQGANFVIVPAGVPRKPGMTRGDLLNINSSICASLAESIAVHSPEACILVISNPVNSTVPIFKEILSKHGVFDPRKLFGVTALDHVRSNTFLSELIDGALPNHYDVPVVGGHSGHSIVPLFTQSKGHIPSTVIDDEIILDNLIHRVQYGGDEVVEAKKGKGSSTLSMAYAANKFFTILLNGYLNLRDVKISSYIYLDDSIPGVTQLKKDLTTILGDTQLPKFLATPMIYGPNGVEKVDYTWVKKMNSKELEMFLIATDFINQNVEKGIEFITG